eukprot:8591118-Karenia_brevis.AAC.1
MFAGQPGTSAQDAWYLAALDLEEARVQGADFLGGTSDLYKCFDQVVRLLLYATLIISGISPRIVTAYSSYHEHTLIYHAFD